MKPAFYQVLLCGLVLPLSMGADEPLPRPVDDLQSSLPSVRVQAANALGRAGDRSAVPLLITALRDSQNNVRREAAKALGYLKDDRAADALVVALADPDPNVRMYAAYALGEIKVRRTTVPLLRALRDDEWCVRDQAAWALRETGDPQIVPLLASALAEPGADVPHITWLLRHLGSSRAVEPLAAMLSSPDVALRTRAVRALRLLSDESAVDPLINALQDADAGVRLAAVAALAALGDDRAKRPLQQLAAREQDPDVRAAAERAVLEFSARSQLAAWWSFDDRSTRVATDVTGGGTNGEIHGCTPVPGKVGHALKFRKPGYIELGKPATLPIGNLPLTVMAWIKPETDNGVVVARGGAFCGFSLYVKDGLPKFGIHRFEDGPTSIAAGRKRLADTWVHLAGVIKNDRIELYVNGRLAVTTETDGYIPGNCGQGMEIGYDTGNSPAEIVDHFVGLIDEVKVYHAALSEEDIADECAPQ